MVPGLLLERTGRRSTTASSPLRQAHGIASQPFGGFALIEDGGRQRVERKRLVGASLGRKVWAPRAERRETLDYKSRTVNQGPHRIEKDVVGLSNLRVKPEYACNPQIGAHRVLTVYVELAGN